MSITPEAVRAARLVAAKIAVNTDVDEVLPDLFRLNDVLRGTPPAVVYPAVSAVWAGFVNRHAPDTLRHPDGYVSVAANTGIGYGISEPDGEDVDQGGLCEHQRDAINRAGLRVAAIPFAVEMFCRACANGDHIGAAHIMTNAVTDHSTLIAWLTTLCKTAAVCMTHAADNIDLEN